MVNAVKQVAAKTGIPDSHILNGWNLLRENPPKDGDSLFLPDNIHPTGRGYGIIAQEAFMMLSMNQEWHKRQSLVTSGLDDLYNKAVQVSLNQLKS